MMSIWNSYQGDLSIPSIALLDFIFQTVSIIDFIYFSYNRKKSVTV